MKPTDNMQYKGLLVSAFLMLSAAFFSSAQEKNSINLGFQARIDYQREYLDGKSLKSDCGFRGQNVSILLDGRVWKKFYYKFRQRLSRPHSDESLFSATDHLYLAYDMNDRWRFSAGKQSVEVGGYEYDLAPIDVYFLSEYTSNVICYRFAVNADYRFKNGKDRLTAQFCQSPVPGGENDLYACNLMWRGTHGRVGTIWSANLIEYLPGEYMSYLSLGTRARFGGFTLSVDVMNRSVADKVTLMKDFTLIGKAEYSFGDKLNVFAKASHDSNDLEEGADWCVLSGTHISRVGGGLEYFPLSNRKLRLHAVFCHSFGENGNDEGALQPNQQFFSIGLTWRMNFLSLSR